MKVWELQFGRKVAVGHVFTLAVAYAIIQAIL
jgi:hypothetical protein